MAAFGRDRVWLAILAVSFLFGLGVSWERWGNPLIDTGREMNQPLRLAAGETLYSDVRHIYGPLSPWLHATLFRVVGPSLWVLYGDGILTAVLVLWLVYWLGRQIMGPAAAGAATLSVMYLCVFKPAGNYILPYSYNALHGTALSLLTLVVLAIALKNGDPIFRFGLAGVLAGGAALAKTEAGVAALAAGIVAAWLSSSRAGWRIRALRMAVFALPALCLPAVVYGAIALHVGWSTLVDDSWLLISSVPPELRHYNAWISGLANPAQSLGRMLIATAKLGILAAVIAAISNILASRRHGKNADTSSMPHSQVPTPRLPPGRVLLVAVLTALGLSLTTGLDWDKGPYLAMPLLLIGLLAALTGRLRLPGLPGGRDRAVLATCAVFALVSLARMILHVRSGGAHASYLLPVSVVLFTYLWTGPFAASFASPRAGRRAATVALSLIALDAAATAVIQAYRYRTRQTIAITSPRGTMVATTPVGQAWNEALAFIDRHTTPGDPVAVMPEGTSLIFLSGRRNPLREEITTPGYLDHAGEIRTMTRLAETGTPLVMIVNRPTGEFGPVAFGRDYNCLLMRWIEDHYTRCATFGPGQDPALQIGDPPFFIRAYCAR